MRCLTGVLMAARVKLPTRTLTDETGTGGAPGSQPHTGQLGGRSQRDEAKRAERHEVNTSAQTSLALRCGTSDPQWAQFPELEGRHCILPAGHAGSHIAQRDDETHEQTLGRVLSAELFAAGLQDLLDLESEGTP